VTVDDADSLAANARHIKAVVPELTRNLQIKAGGAELERELVGTTPNYPVVKNYTLTAGACSAQQRRGRRRVRGVGSAIPGHVQREIRSP